MLKQLRVMIAATFALVGFAATPVEANQIIQDGTFQNAVGSGTNLSPWSDWTSVGITTEAAPAGVGGNAAVIPFGGDLFQWFPALTDGIYRLNFYAQNASPNPAALVFSLQQAFGTPVAVTFPLGLGQQINLPAYSDFVKWQLVFEVSSFAFPVNELYFSNSYDYPEPLIADSINPPGTILKIANVSLVKIAAAPVPEPATWFLMVAGLGLVGAQLRRRTKLADSLIA